MKTNEKNNVYVQEYFGKLIDTYTDMIDAAGCLNTLGVLQGECSDKTKFLVSCLIYEEIDKKINLEEICNRIESELNLTHPKETIEDILHLNAYIKVLQLWFAKLVELRENKQKLNAASIKYGIKASKYLANSPETSVS